MNESADSRGAPRYQILKPLPLFLLPWLAETATATSAFFQNHEVASFISATHEVFVKCCPKLLLLFS